MDGDDGVLAIHLAGEHGPRLSGLDVALEGVEAAVELRRDVLAAAGPVHQHAEVVALLSQRFGERAVVFETLAPLQGLLRRRLVLPEIGAGDLRFEIAELARQACFVKAPSGDRRRVW